MHHVESDESEIGAEALELIDELERNVSEATLAKVDEFMNRSPAHAQCFEERVLLLNSLPRELFARADPILPRSARETKRRAVSSRWGWVGVAAAAATIAAVAVITWSQVDLRSSPSEKLTASEESREIALPDGSNLLLYRGASATAHMRPDKRTVHLAEGGVAVQVEKDFRRPFTVITDDAEILAVGTEFNVIRRDGRTDVCVREGLVRVSRDGRVKELKAGESIAVLSSSGEFVALDGSDATPGGGTEAQTGSGRSASKPEVARLARSSDALIRHFSNATLTDIAAAFNEVNCSVQLEVAPDVGGPPLNADLDLSRPEQWASDLAAVDASLRTEAKMGLIRIARH
jgi:ferric-dicitrate binding protein FerR (iron transport regulator)